MVALYYVISICAVSYIAHSATNQWGFYDVAWYWDALIWAALFIVSMVALEQLYPAWAKADARTEADRQGIQQEKEDYEKSWKCRACGHRRIRS